MKAPIRTSLARLAALFGMAVSMTIATPAQAEVTHIDNAQLRRLIDQGVPVIDIRTAPEWAETGVIKGSHLLTFFDQNGRYDAAAWLAQVQKIATPEQAVVVICRSGSRTLPVSRLLDQAAQYRTVYNVRAGIGGWIKAGLPVAAAAPVPLVSGAAVSSSAGHAAGGASGGASGGAPGAR